MFWGFWKHSWKIATVYFTNQIWLNKKLLEIVNMVAIWPHNSCELIFWRFTDVIHTRRGYKILLIFLRGRLHSVRCGPETAYTVKYTYILKVNNVYTRIVAYAKCFVVLMLQNQPWSIAATFPKQCYQFQIARKSYSMDFARCSILPCDMYIYVHVPMYMYQ